VREGAELAWALDEIRHKGVKLAGWSLLTRVLRSLR
jgi:hypothetical protein